MASRVPDAKILKALTQHVLADGTPNYSAASKALGISRTNLQHHAERLGLRAKPEPLLPPEQRQIIALADENKKLKAQMRELHRDALDSEAMRQILGGMVSEQSRRVHFVEGKHWFEATGDFFAMGSGQVAALAAMHCGASAKKAVEIACKLDAGSALPIHYLNLANPPKGRRNAAAS